MKCSSCANPAVIYQAYSGKALCKMHFIQLTEDRIRRTITKNKLLRPHDKVAIAVSGGKDSIAACHFLKNFSKKMPMTLHAILIDEGVKARKTAIETAKKELKQLEIPFTIRSFKKEHGKTMDQMRKGTKHPCSLCGVLRRNLINKTARELKATKLATGHNLDDEVQSAIMNFFRGDYARMSRMGAKTEELGRRSEGAKGRRDNACNLEPATCNPDFVQRIKILRDIPEKEMGLYAIVNKFGYTEERCPYAEKALRQTIRDTLNQIEETHPGTKFAIMKSSENLVEILKKHFKEHPSKLFKCSKCGEPSINEVCKKCKMLGQI